jgi:hypothetical protein
VSIGLKQAIPTKGPPHATRGRSKGQLIGKLRVAGR